MHNQHFFPVFHIVTERQGQIIESPARRPFVFVEEH